MRKLLRFALRTLRPTRSLGRCFSGLLRPLLVEARHPRMVDVRYQIGREPKRIDRAQSKSRRLSPCACADPEPSWLALACFRPEPQALIPPPGCAAVARDRLPWRALSVAWHSSEPP